MPRGGAFRSRRTRLTVTGGWRHGVDGGWKTRPMPRSPHRRPSSTATAATATATKAIPSALVVVTILVALGCSKGEDPASPAATTPGSPATSAPTATAPATSAPTTATTAPTTTAIPTTVTGPPPTTGTAIRAVDFGEQVLPADSCGPVFVSPPPAGYQLHGGEARQGSPGDPTFYAIAARPDPAYGDVDGDGQEDAVLLVDCSPGSSPVTFAWVFGPGGTGGAVQRLGGLTLDPATRTRLDSFGDPRLTGVALEGSTIVTTWGTHQPGDPICCPTGQATVRFSWSGAAFTPSS